MFSSKLYTLFISEKLIEGFNSEKGKHFLLEKETSEKYLFQEYSFFNPFSFELKILSTHNMRFVCF